jgi:hypothetical protein
MLNKIINRLQLAASVLRYGELPTQKRNPISAITPEEVADAREFFSMDKFFIFGHARSGTTLLTRLVRLHPEVHCNYQGHFFTRKPLLKGLVDTPEMESWLTRRSNRWNQGQDLSPLVLRAVSDFIMERDARKVGKNIVGDKSPSGLMNGAAVQLLHEVYPDAKLVFIVRDGRDTALSHRFQRFIDATQHLTKEDWTIRNAFAANPDLFFAGEKSVFTEKAIREEVESWVANLTETDQMGKELFGDAYLSLRYEDLLSDTKFEMQRAWQLLGAEATFEDIDEVIASEMGTNLDADWQKEKAAEIAEPLQKGKAGSWQDLFTERDKNLYNELGGQTLIDWNYERDLDW